MLTIRLFREPGVDVNLAAISKHLNKLCTTVEFVCGDSLFELPSATVVHPDSYNTLPQAIKEETQGDYRALLVTKKRYSNHFFFQTHHNLVILSFHAWEHLTTLPLNNGLVFFVADILALDIDRSFRHHDDAPRPECIYDFGWNKSGVDIGMRSAMICPDCLSRVKALRLSDKKRRLLCDLQQILNALGNASKWETDITDYWAVQHAKPSTAAQAGRNQVFICYSHVDSEWLGRLKTHLKPFERDSVIQVWDDTRIATGDDWLSAIEAALESTKVAVLLVSPDFLASDFIAKKEIPHLLEAARSEGAIIMPIILKPCGFKRIPALSQFQSVNPPSRTLVEMNEGEQERFLLKLTEDILVRLA